jgi:hypothetical protein
MSSHRRCSVGRLAAALLPLLLSLVPSAEAQLRARVFAGTWGPDGAGQGHVHRYEDGVAWTRLSPPGGLGDAVWDLEWHEGELWATTHEGPAASTVDLFLRADTPHGDLGRVFRWDGTTWTDHSPPGGFGSAATTVSSMDGTVYVTVDREGLYRWEGGTTWTLLGEFIMGAQAIVSRSHDGVTDMLYLGQDNTDEFWVHDPTGALTCGDWLGDPRSTRTDCQEPVAGEVCSADCWPGSCIHALAEFDAGDGARIYGGAFSRKMYAWDPATRLFDEADSVPMAPPNGERAHVQGLAAYDDRLWVGMADGRLWSTADATEATYLMETEFGPEWPISDLYTAQADDLLWIGFGAVPWRWARNDGVSRIMTWDGSSHVERGLAGAFGEGVLALLAVEPEVFCDAGPEQTVECTGDLIPVQLDGSATEVPPALETETTYLWTGPFVEGSATGPDPIVHFDGPGSYPVTLTVRARLSSDSCETLIHVVDTEPPALVANADCLWPPNHRYRCFRVDQLVAGGLGVALDDCEGEVDVRIVAASSSQPEEEIGRGDGNTQDDVLFDGGMVCVRAERQGDDPAGRDYTVVLETVDGAGNVARAEAVIHVPHDQRPGSRCPERPVEPGLSPKAQLPLGPDAIEGGYPEALRPRD